MDSARRRQAGPLLPIELALAGVMSSVIVALTVIAWMIPQTGPLFFLGAVPMGIVAHRLRPRALITAGVAGFSVAFLIGGLATASGVIFCTLIGGIVGEVERRRGSWRLMALWSAGLGVAAAGLIVVLLTVLAEFRALLLGSIHGLVFGVTGLIGQVHVFEPAAESIERFADAAILNWRILLAAAVLIATVVISLVVRAVLGPVLERLSWIALEDVGSADRTDVVGPLPVQFHDVSFRYPGATADALTGIDLTLGPSEFVVVVGANGSGKSTLVRLLAGRVPTAGGVRRKGGTGLGIAGGTAWISQRPEGQILGATVADDVVWGLPPTAHVDVERTLGEVGLTGMGARDTATLSGGELQRLAIGAALARRPSFLISDESTAMVDSDGRRALLALLGELPRRGTSVLHVSHDPDEIAPGHRVITLDSGRIVEGLREAGPPNVRAVRRAAVPPSAERLLVVRQLRHVYAAGSPWEKVALNSIDLDVGTGEGLLVVGGNGSGKSTLAWILAGLLAPTAGSVLVDGAPAAARRGSVLLAFQHARLQVQGRDVRSDLAQAAGLRDEHAVAAVLRTVGLDASLAGRPVDTLSGGQLRRVALAGLIARRPRMLILDEPLAGLDPDSRDGVLQLMTQARLQEGLSLMVISHDNRNMQDVCPRTVELVDGRVLTRTPVEAAR